MKRLYIRAEMPVDLQPVLKKIKIPENKIGIITTVQFEHEVKRLKDSRFIFGGSILGCNIDNPLKITMQLVERVETEVATVIPIPFTEEGAEAIESRVVEGGFCPPHEVDPSRLTTW